MTAKSGDKIPNIELYEVDKEFPTSLYNASYGKRILVIGVPGAFSPDAEIHLPNYLKNVEKLKKQGFSDIFCVSMNDKFVMKAWARDLKTCNKIRMIADTEGVFTKSLGLELDSPEFGGFRSRRYAMAVSNGFIEQLRMENSRLGTGFIVAESWLPGFQFKANINTKITFHEDKKYPKELITNFHSLRYSNESSISSRESLRNSI